MNAKKIPLSALAALGVLLTALPAAAVPGVNAVFVGEDGEVQNVEIDEPAVWVAEVRQDGEGQEKQTKEVRVIVLGDEGGEHRYEVETVGGEPVIVGPRQHYAHFVEELTRRGYLGVGLVELTPELRTHFGAPEDAGVLVGSVEEDSPAAAAGIRVGDVLTSLDGEAVASSWEVRHHIRGLEEGDPVTVAVVRDGRSLSLTAKVVEKERPEIDIRRFLGRHEGGEHSFYTIDPGEIQVHVDQLRRRLESPELRTRIQTLHSLEGQLEERIKELEKRIQELEKERQER